MFCPKHSKVELRISKSGNLYCDKCRKILDEILAFSKKDNAPLTEADYQTWARGY